MAARSLLFVPGSRPDRFAKALATAADVVCLDLEDAVAPDGKAQARETVARTLGEGGTPRLGVRINGWTTANGPDDARALASVGAGFVMLPKVERPDELAALRDALGPAAPPLWPLVESAEGLRRAWEIAAAPGVGGVLFGGADFAADVGCELAWEPLLYARGALAAACARAGVELLDVPHLDVRDAEGLRESTARAKAMGFTGRACIHPDQVEVVNAVFAPTEAELARARRVLEAFEAAGSGVALLDGKLIEIPVVRAARCVLGQA